MTKLPRRPASPTCRRLEKDIATSCLFWARRDSRSDSCCRCQRLNYSGRSHFIFTEKTAGCARCSRGNALSDGSPPTKDPESPRWHPLSKMNVEMKSGSRLQ